MSAGANTCFAEPLPDAHRARSLLHRVAIVYCFRQGVLSNSETWYLIFEMPEGPVFRKMRAWNRKGKRKLSDLLSPERNTGLKRHPGSGIGGVAGAQANSRDGEGILS